MRALVLIVFFMLETGPAIAETGVERQWFGRRDVSTPLSDRPAAQNQQKPEGFWNSFRPYVEPPQTAPAPPAQTYTPAASKPTKRRAKKRRRTVKPAVRRTTTRKKQVTAIRRSPATNTARRDARWWQKVGNPSLARFRLCLVNYANTTGGRSDVSEQTVVMQAMDQDCRDPFDEFALLLFERFGMDGYENISRELIETTVLPAVRDAGKS